MVWRTKTGEMVNDDFYSHSDVVTCLAFLPVEKEKVGAVAHDGNPVFHDSDTLFSASLDHTIKLWVANPLFRIVGRNM